MSIRKDLSELMEAGVITKETAENIQTYYKNKEAPSSNRLFLVFGILGSTLVGLGIILILAHNWDELTRSTKTVFAFLPLLIGQVLCVFTLLKKEDSSTWRESSAAFLFFALGASISLISQIYNIPGKLSSFIITWMLLALPLVYIMRASVVSLLYLIGITQYACQVSYWTHPYAESYLFWLLLLLALPHYYLLIKKSPNTNFLYFHHWFIPLAITIVLGTIAKSTGELMFVAYFSLFGMFYLIGENQFFNQQKTINNGFKIIGTIGTIALLLVLSYDWFWSDLRTRDWKLEEVLTAPEFILAVLLTLSASVLLYFHQKEKGLVEIQPIVFVFLLFLLTFLIGLVTPVAAGLINLITFLLGLFTIREGARQNHLGILNYGLLIVALLVLCRFFDEEISFVFRGILFVLTGVGFIGTNYWMLKKRKTHEA